MKKKTFVLLGRAEGEPTYKVIGKPSRDFNKILEEQTKLSMKNPTTDYIISHK